VINKIYSSAFDALAGVEDGAIVLIGGFGEVGNPTELVHALIDQGARELTVVNNNAGTGEVGLAALLKAGRIAKIICSYPRTSDPHVFNEMYRANKVALEVVPQGTLAERIRAGGAGLGGFYTRTSTGTPLAEGKPTREYEGDTYVLEDPIRADYALVKCLRADRMGNLTYYKTARNFGPIMCTAAKTTIVQCKEYVAAGQIDPEHVVTPSIFVDRIVEIEAPWLESQLIKKNITYQPGDQNKGVRYD